MLLRVFGNFFAQSGGVGFEKIGVYDRFFLSFKKKCLCGRMCSRSSRRAGRARPVSKRSLMLMTEETATMYSAPIGMQRPDVCAVVDFVRRDGMAEAVPREENDVLMPSLPLKTGLLVSP